MCLLQLAGTAAAESSNYSEYYLRKLEVSGLALGLHCEDIILHDASIGYDCEQGFGNMPRDTKR